ncbi:MAG: hypothetical protein AMXMBFR81_13970 [Chthonomonas sp.]
MAELWRAPLTEEGMQEVLRRLEECRREGDDLETGYGLLELSHMVKWVRSDTDAEPFVRSSELAREAEAVFRRIGHKPGLVRALIAALPFAPSYKKSPMLREAEAIAEECGSEELRAKVLEAKGRTIALADRDSATDCYKQAKAIYSTLGDKMGVASCLFGLAIADATPEAKRDWALDGAEVYAELGDDRHVSMCFTIALMHAEECQPLEELEPLALRALEADQRFGDPERVAAQYRKLAQVATARGETEKAKEYERLAAILDDVTPHEAWQRQVEALGGVAMIATMTGNQEFAAEFAAAMTELLEQEPENPSPEV